jgi:hypothetical protein
MSPNRATWAPQPTPPIHAGPHRGAQRIRGAIACTADTGFLGNRSEVGQVAMAEEKLTLNMYLSLIKSAWVSQLWQYNACSLVDSNLLIKTVQGVSL